MAPKLRRVWWNGRRSASRAWRTEECGLDVDSIKRVAVIGAGLMGHGIALEFAVAGYEVSLTDSDEAVLASSPERIRAGLRTMTSLALVASDRAAAAPERIQTTADLAAAVAEADVVIEAVSENLALKQAIFAEMDRLSPPDAILASNSSSFMPSEVGEQVERRGRVLVAHYFNPPHLLSIVELVRGPETDDEVVETMRQLYLRIGKRPAVVQKEAPGFVGNRLQIALFREALSLVQQGIASVEDVDTVVRFGFGRRLAAAGPFEIADAAGADLWAQVATNLMPEIDTSTAIPPFYEAMLERGETGMKAGKGFHTWTPEAADETRDRIARVLAATSELLDR
jgi:3-hydroxybutyryl-CoA dehydrogenase